MYQKMGTTTFVVLNCVPVDNVSVLFVDGTVTCYTHWQYAVLAYAAGCVTPFCIVLLVAPSMLRRRQLSVVAFFAACLCPLPFLVVWLISHLWRYARPPSPPTAETREPLDPGTLAVLGILLTSCSEVQGQVKVIQQSDLITLTLALSNLKPRPGNPARAV